ncbi:fimbrial biogenesis chaperone [Proteus vulgaris]|uniref:Fimbria/pilus periplasmic chaperone n=1 Tax=Proteus vulgaris TaxID=585 RepID=A0A6G6SDS1_PROVU|nr:molecular chaperone [Proteus vulgaris]QIF92577.1 fimbria/pilus periplasmic chaperone [Proteus vulgaris]
MKKNIFLTLFFCFSLITVCHAAGISVGGTRFVYNDNAREISIPVLNTDKDKPYLIQSWVSAFQGNDKAPFIATPPLFRIEPDSTGTARISYTGEPLNSNTEVVYWLNIKSIPPVEKSPENQLQLVINSQFKLFLRAHDIEPLNFNNVELSKQNQGLVLKNNTPYHLTIKHIFIDDKRYPYDPLIQPHQEVMLLEKTPTYHKVKVQFINDYGATVDKVLN